MSRIFNFLILKAWKLLINLSKFFYYISSTPHRIIIYSSLMLFEMVSRRVDGVSNMGKVFHEEDYVYYTSDENDPGAVGLYNKI